MWLYQNRTYVFSILEVDKIAYKLGLSLVNFKLETQAEWVSYYMLGGLSENLWIVKMQFFNKSISSSNFTIPAISIWCPVRFNCTNLRMPESVLLKDLWPPTPLNLCKIPWLVDISHMTYYLPLKQYRGVTIENRRAEKRTATRSALLCGGLITWPKTTNQLFLHKFRRGVRGTQILK